MDRGQGRPSHSLPVSASHTMTSKMKVAGLRAALEAAGADTTGKKAVLVERLEALRAEPAKMKVADLRAALEAAGADTTGKKAVLVKRLEDVRAAHAEPEPAPKSTSVSSSSSSAAAAAAAPAPVQQPRTGPFAILPTVLLGEIFAALGVHERCAAARACADFVEASRTVIATKRLYLPPRCANRVDDATLRRLLTLSVAGGALTQVVVRDAGKLLTPGAFEPLTGCKTLEMIDIRGSARLGAAVEEDDRMYSVIDSMIPFVPDREAFDRPYEYSSLVLLQPFVEKLVEDKADPHERPFSEMYIDWVKSAGLELDGDGGIGSSFVDPDTAQRLWDEGGSEEVHRRIEDVRIEQGTGHADFAFRHFLRDHRAPLGEEEVDVDDLPGEFYGRMLAARLGRAAYWRARAVGQTECHICDRPLVAKPESMNPEVADMVYSCLGCSIQLCGVCAHHCEECSSAVCPATMTLSCNSRIESGVRRQNVVFCSGPDCLVSRCPAAFRSCESCARPVCNACTSWETDACQECEQGGQEECQNGCCCPDHCICY